MGQQLFLIIYVCKVIQVNDLQVAARRRHLSHWNTTIYTSINLAKKKPPDAIQAVFYHALVTDFTASCVPLANLARGFLGLALYCSALAYISRRGRERLRVKLTLHGVNIVEISLWVKRKFDYSSR